MKIFLNIFDPLTKDIFFLEIWKSIKIIQGEKHWIEPPNDSNGVVTTRVGLHGGGDLGVDLSAIKRHHKLVGVVELWER